MQPAHTLFAAASVFILSMSATLADSIDGRVVYADLFELSVGVDGIVSGIAALEGERVLAGTQLLALDDEAVNASIAAETANMALIKEELAESKRGFDRDQALYDEGSLSTVELDLARIEMLRQTSRVAAVKTALARAKSEKAMGQIVAPVAGTVVRLNVAMGQRVSMSALQKPMLVFAGNALKVVCRIETDSVSIPVLLDKVQITAGSASVAGMVRTILRENDSTVVTISIDASQPAFAPGALVAVEF